MDKWRQVFGRVIFKLKRLKEWQIPLAEFGLSICEIENHLNDWLRNMRSSQVLLPSTMAQIGLVAWVKFTDCPLSIYLINNLMIIAFTFLLLAMKNKVISKS